VEGAEESGQCVEHYSQSSSEYIGCSPLFVRGHYYMEELEEEEEEEKCLTPGTRPGNGRVEELEVQLRTECTVLIVLNSFFFFLRAVLHGGDGGAAEDNGSNSGRA